MMRTFISTVCSLLISLGAAAPAQADFTNEMVARWTFNEDGDKLLVDDVSGVVMEERGVGVGQTTHANADGTVTLGPGRLLFAPVFNSNERPELQQSVTLWARIRIDAPPRLFVVPFGLLNAPQAADWPELTLVAGLRESTDNDPGGFIVYGRDASGDSAGNGSDFPPLKPNVFHNIAVVYDAKQHTITLYVDGKAVSRKNRKWEDGLQPFEGLGIGRLKHAHGVEMVVDELRVYRVALPAEWLGEIEPVVATSR